MFSDTNCKVFYFWGEALVLRSFNKLPSSEPDMLRIMVFLAKKLCLAKYWILWCQVLHGYNVKVREKVLYGLCYIRFANC